MKDTSVIKPIIEALEYFDKSDAEIQFFYNIIDKFSAQWFGSQVNVSRFTKVDLMLIHELLGEFLRFDANNRRVALWLLAINRICYNYSADLTEVKRELERQELLIDETSDTSLVDPIINNMKEFNRLHQEAGIDNKGEADKVGNFLQWVGLYTTYIYPSLENKLDYYDKNVLNTMHYLLMEFIKQKSNDKRLALLIMALAEACKHYNFHNGYESTIPDFELDGSNSQVLAGQDEALVGVILRKLKAENEKQRHRPALTKEILADKFVKDSFDKFISELNSDPYEAVTTFNNYITLLSTKFLNFDEGKRFLFIQTLDRYRVRTAKILDKEVLNNLKRSVSLLSENTLNWFQKESRNMEEKNELYIDYILKKVKEEKYSKSNIVKLFVMLYFIKKFSLLEN